MSSSFSFGDRVRHQNRPEWGIGSVTKVQTTHRNGTVLQSLAVRFPNVGLKQLTSEAPLEHVNGEIDVGESAPESPLAEWAGLEESEWLAPVAQKKIREVMTALPQAASDPFTSLKRRLEFTLNLYRFDKSGRGLIDWAVAQSGLDDPMNRFNRQDLEQFFDRWSVERDAHLGRLLRDPECSPRLQEDLLSRAPAAAVKACKRLNAAVR